ncbi:DUF58 domain-containing protein [Plantactinospora siamensis]|uniref:DUF58 domain-containing protein n=1 Tax=Plantactinospora siamensis TaxID=555372 RepID=A0ABV6NW84_9ACTN
MRITSRGIGLLAAAAALLLVGLRFDYPELTVLGTTAGLALACGLGNALGRPRLEVTRLADPDRVGRGEPASMTLTVRNRGRLRTASLIAEDRCGGRAVPVPLLRLRPGRDTTVGYPVPTSRRGVVPVGPLRLTARDALGLVTLARSVGGTTEVWVHPRVHPLGAVPAGVNRSLDGRLDRVPHGSITFDALREYVVGDELRRVHWRTSARVGELMVREHVDTSLPRIVVVLDDRAAAHPEVVDGVAESFESACEAAASVLTAAYREALPVTLLLVAGALADPAGSAGSAGSTGSASPAGSTASAGSTGPAGGAAGAGPGAGGGQPTGFLDHLAAVTLHPSRPRRDELANATTRLRQDRRGDTLVFLTGPGAADDLGRIGALRGAYPSVVVGIFGAGAVPPAGGPGVVLIAAADGAEFAAEWDGVRRW